MVAVNGEWVNDLAAQFNASQKEYKIVPVFKGSYDESMTAAVAAFRAGKTFALTGRLPDGRTIDSRSNPMPGGGVVRGFRDVSERAGYIAQLTEALASGAARVQGIAAAVDSRRLGPHLGQELSVYLRGLEAERAAAGHLQR